MPYNWPIRAHVISATNASHIIMGEYQPKVLIVQTSLCSGHTKKREGQIFSQYGLRQAWLKEKVTLKNVYFLSTLTKTLH